MPKLAVKEVIPCSWRERRGPGWSETLYVGFLMRTEEEGDLLVSKLSHRLRVLSTFDKTYYRFEYRFERAGEPVTVSLEFLNKALEAYKADYELQNFQSEFEKVVSCVKTGIV